MQIASSMATKDFAGYFEQAVFSLPFIAASCKKRPHFYVQAFL